MQSPAAEWTLAIGHLAVLDYVRHRGEADADTLSEVLRGIVDRTPRGELLFNVGLGLGALWFRSHILAPLKR